jgi:aspartate carbamoyltransferase catalytic subunit
MHSRVALSNIYCLQKLGAEVLLAGPPTLIPRHIKSMGVDYTHSVKDALVWCDAVNILRIQLERQHKPLFSTLREYAQYFGVNMEMINSLKKDIVIMHPGPINRGVEITSEVADAGRSIILDQVENGVAVRMAIIYLLSGKRGGVE